MLFGEKMEIKKLIVFSITILLVKSLLAQGIKPSSWPTDEAAMTPTQYGTSCAKDPEKTRKMLETLQDRSMCEFAVSPQECYKISLAGGSGANMAGRIAAQKALGIGRINLNPDKHMVCSLDFSYNNMFSLLVSPAHAKYCRFNKPAIFADLIDDIAKHALAEAKALEIKVVDQVQGVINSAVAKAEAEAAEEAAQNSQSIASAKKDSLFRKMGEKLGTSELPLEKHREFKADADALYNKFQVALKNEDSNAAARLEKALSELLKKNNINFGPSTIKGFGFATPESPTAAKVKIAQEKLANITRVLGDSSASKEIISRELAELSKLFPEIKPDAFIAETQKLRGLQTKANLSFGISRQYKVDSGVTGSKKVTDAAAQEEMKKAITKLEKQVFVGGIENPQVLQQFMAAVQMTKQTYAETIRLVSLARTMSARHLMVALRIGTMGLAATGVGMLPAIASAAVQEVGVRAGEATVIRSTEDCESSYIKQYSNISDAERLALSMVDFDGRCNVSASFNGRFTEIFQLDTMSQIKLASASGHLCKMITDLVENEFPVGQKAICSSTSGDFTFMDVAGGKTAERVLDLRKQEAKEAGLAGKDYEDYLTMSSGASLTHTVKRTDGQLAVQFTQTNSKMKPCANFEASLTSGAASKSNRECLAFTSKVTQNVFDYGSISNCCAGQGGSYCDMYADKIAMNTTGNGTNGIPVKIRK